MGYAEDVLAGRVTAGRWTRLACERHVRDLETGRERGIRWDEEAASHALAFFRVSETQQGQVGG